MINVMNNISISWWGWMSAMFWQVGLLIVFVACIDMLIKRWAWPQLRYALWLLVVVKLIIPPDVSMRGSLVERTKPGLDWIISSNIKEPSTIAEYSPFIISDDSFVVNQQAPFRQLQAQAMFTPLKQLTDIASPSAEMSESPAVKLIWQSFAFVIWLSGVLVLGLWLILRLRNLRKCQSRKDSACKIPESFHMVMSKCAQRLKLSRIPHVVVTRKVVCPAVFGVFKPTLLIPKGYLGKLSRRDAEHMLLHELAHIKRRDPVIHSFYLILQIVYWFNPLLWLARRQLIHLRELCCDATVARILKHKTNAYRQTLIDIARQFLTKPVEPGLGLLGLFEDANRLLVRLSWLEKKSWRYQKMKNLTVITIITLMLVFVLPMAKAQVESSTEEHVSHSEHINEAPSENITVLKTEEQQPIDEENFSQELKRLQDELKQLEIEKQYLQNELAVLELSRRETTLVQEHAQEHAQENAHEQASEALKKVKAEKDKAKNEYKEAKKISQQMEQWQNSDQFKQWQQEMQQWQSQIQQWQQQMEQWSKEQAINNFQTKEVTGHSGVIQMPHPEPVMPPMPKMPPMIQISPMPFNINVPADADAPADIFTPSEQAAPVVITPEINHRISTTTKVVSPSIHPNIEHPIQPDINIEEDNDNRLTATKEMEFTAKVQPGAKLVVENKVGKIVLVPSQGGNCDVKADIRATAETAEDAQEMVEQVSMNNESSGERFFLKPVKSEDDNWDNLSVDLYITVPSNIPVDISTDIGSIEITDLKTKIKAVANVGSINAVNIVGEIQLTTNVGDIDFAAPHNFSAQLQANTKVGSIESEFPINISKIDFTASQAKGTIGSGEKTVRLKTEVGKIRIKKSS